MSNSKRRVIFFGDSITEQGTGKSGYISQLKTELENLKKEEAFEFIGAGVSGNKVTDLQKRLQKDVLSKNPSIVFIYIGINDVWHSIHFGLRGTEPQKFEKILRDIITKIQTGGAKVIVCTPSVIGEKKDGSNKLDHKLEEYSNISCKLAEEKNTLLCDLRKSFISYLLENNPSNKEMKILTEDGVHLNEVGNKLVAEEMLKVLLML